MQGAIGLGKRNDLGRTRACNLQLRRPMPYPLGHGAGCMFQTTVQNAVSGCICTLFGIVHPFFPTKSCRRLGAAVENIRCTKAAKALQAKADSTLRSSWAVLHPSTDWALRRLTSVVRRDPAHSMRYGRQREELSAMISRSRFRGETHANEKRKAKQKPIAKRTFIRPKSGARKASRSRIRISRSGESCVESSGHVCAQAGSIRCAKRPACPQQPM